MSFNAGTGRATIRTPRKAALAGLLLVAAAVLAFVAYQALAGHRPEILLRVYTQPADGVAFDPVSVTAPAEKVVALSFMNVSTLDHNLVFLDPIGARTRAIVPPGETDRIEFTTPAAGEYQFVCTIHEGMSGSLTVR